MQDTLSRREVLKLAALFATAMAAGCGGEAPPAAGGPAQNRDALDGRSNFAAIYGNPALKAAFLLFLQNVFHLMPEAELHGLIARTAEAGGSDRDIYRAVQAALPSIRPLLADLRYAVPALAKQKAEMARQTLTLLGANPKVDGFLELGSTGRYLDALETRIAITGDVVLVNATAPSYAPVDVLDRGQLGKRGRWLPLADYDPLPSADLQENSLDLVANYIGFHHAPLDKRDGFVRSLHRALRPGGRMVLRDHDAATPEMVRMVALAHDVFNLGTGETWDYNAAERRHFTAMHDLVPYLASQGFALQPQGLLQQGDPTLNTLQVYVKV